MTKLVGQDGTGWTIVSETLPSSGGNCWYYSSAYVATSTGTAQNFHFTVQGTSSASLATCYLYAGIGVGATLIATSAEFSVASTGDKISAITGNIIAGNHYTLVVQTTSGFVGCAVNSGSNNFQDNGNTAANFPYRSAPGRIPAADSNVGQEFIVWIDGVVGGSASLAWVT